MKDGMLRLEIHPRHWMHIWKVGRVPCAKCGDDSRFIVSFLDTNDEIVSQTMYCEHHAPRPLPRTPPNQDFADISSQLRFGLGFSSAANPHVEPSIIDAEESAD